MSETKGRDGTLAVIAVVETSGGNTEGRKNEEALRLHWIGIMLEQ